MAHPPVHQSRRRPATAAAESGQRQRSPEKAWRSHLDSPPVFVGSRCDGAAHPDHSMGRGDYLPGTRRGGVNDPAGLPAWRPVRLHPCRWLGVPVGAPMKRTPARRRGPKPHPAVGVITLRKQPVCLRSSKAGRRARSVPGGYVGLPEDRLYEPRSRHLGDLFKILFPNRLDHTLLSPAARSTVPS